MCETNRQREVIEAVERIMPYQKGLFLEMHYDIECVKRIVKHFYRVCSSILEGLIVMAKLIEEFLFEVASDRELEIGFVSLVEMSSAASMGTDRSSGGYTEL